VLPIGFDPLLADSYRALPRLLTEQCRDGGCKGITADPVADLRELSSRLERRTLRGTVLDAEGRPSPRSLNATGLAAMVLAGDLNTYLQAALPAAIRSALDGRARPLLRLIRPAAGPPLRLKELSLGLNVATVCADTPLSYSIAEPLDARPQKMAAALSSRPDADLGPFSRRVVGSFSVDEQCRLYPPTQVPRPPASAPLPDVPALLVNGRLDVRTPVENARLVAAELPRAQLVTVPGNGHDPFDTDVSGCVTRAIGRFFSNRRVGTPCAGRDNAVPPLPLAPRSLARVAPAPGTPGDRGRVLRAAIETMHDVRTAWYQHAGAGFAGQSGGGLRAGRWQLFDSDLFVLRGVSWVPGVRVTPRRGVTGVLGGRRVHLEARFARGALPRSQRNVRGLGAYLN
jgi:pimeloyl-ACP methyl ester carboxylesterase